MKEGPPSSGSDSLLSVTIVSATTVHVIYR